MERPRRSRNASAAHDAPSGLSDSAWAAIEHLRAVRLLAEELPGDAAHRMRVEAAAASVEELIARRRGGADP